MTIPSTTRRAGPYIGTGALVSYPFSFKVFDKNDLAIKLAFDYGAELTLVVDSTALVTLNVDQDALPGGVVQYAVGGVATALPVGVSLVILSALPYEQATDLPAGGAFRAEVVEGALDALAIQNQQLAEIISRALTVPAAFADSISTLPAPEAGKALGWNSTEDGLININVGGLPPGSDDEFVTPEDFFASGNGIADDGSALEAMFAASLKIDLGRFGKRYLTNRTLYPRNNTIIRGFGGGRLVQGNRQVPVFNADNASDVSFFGVVVEAAQLNQVPITALVPGKVYSILTTGTSNFTSVTVPGSDGGGVSGANSPGRYFTATGPGTGTGVASEFYNTPNSQDIAIRCNYAVNLVVQYCRFYGFGYSAISMQLWGEKPTITNNLFQGPGASVLNPLNAADPQTPGFRNCTGATLLCHNGLFAENVISETSEGFIIGQQSTNTTVRGNIVLNTIVEHGGYIDTACQRVVAKDNIITNPRLIGMKVQWYDQAPIAVTNAALFIKGGYYVIVSVGTTDFTTIGAASNTVGLQFKATGVGTGTGTVTHPAPKGCRFTDNQIYNTGTGGDGLIFLNSAPLDIATITGISKPTKGTAANATTNSAGYAVGATVITLASAGTGTILVNDMVQFGNDQNYYRVTAGDSDVSNGGSITIASPGLLVAIPASATAISVRYSPGVVTINAAPSPALAVDDWVVLDNVGGMTPMRSAFYIHTVLSPTTFIPHLHGLPVDTSGFPNFTSGGTLRRPVCTDAVIRGNTIVNAGQDGISLRYVNGGIVEGNTVDGIARQGIAGSFVGDLTIGPNKVLNTQDRGINMFTPTDAITIGENQVTNPGAAGIDTAGASSGVFFEGDGGGVVRDNVARGDRSRTKMLYAYQHGSGDKSQWSIIDNEGYDAESAVVALHGLDNRSYRQLRHNVGTSASGINTYTGLATALPNVGNPVVDLWGDTTPTTGYWQQETALWKRTPATGDPMGYHRITSGSNNTDWRPMGMVHGCLPTQALQGTYTPTCSAATNITGGTGGVSFGPTFYEVHGGYCTVEGYVVVNANAPPITVTLRLTLPIAALLGTADQGLWGMGLIGELNYAGTGRISNNGANDEAAFSIYIANGAAGNVRIYYRYTYKLNP